MRCDFDTYVVADASSISDGFVAFATCNGLGGDCGWDVSLGDSVGLSNADWAALNLAHWKFSVRAD